MKLQLFLVAVTLCFPVPILNRSPPVYQPRSINLPELQENVVGYLVKEAEAQSVPVSLVLAVAWRESHYISNSVHCCNRNGTRDWGVMQLNDIVLDSLGVKEPLEYRQNIRAGVSLLAVYVKKYHSTARVVCAYMKGPGNCK